MKAILPVSRKTMSMLQLILDFVSQFRNYETRRCLAWLFLNGVGVLDWTGGIRECLQVLQHIEVREHDWLNSIETEHRWNTPSGGDPSSNSKSWRLIQRFPSDYGARRFQQNVLLYLGSR